VRTVSANKKVGMSVWLALVGVLVAALAAALWILLRRRRARSAPRTTNTVAQLSSTADDSAVLFQTTATEQLATDVYALAFAVSRVDYRILGQHQAVLLAAKNAVSQAAREPRYFPRKPTLLPKLLHAINAQDANRGEIVRLILQDPVLAGNVLRRANSAFYRPGSEPVESVDRAVMILGNEGLRSPVATAVMQPVFRLPPGFFDKFAPLTWELAQRTALAAETYARLHNTGDTFVAHLLGLLRGLGRIVLFRLTLDKYRAQPNLMPRAEVFIRVMMDHDVQVARDVAAAWEMSATFVEAIDAQLTRLPPDVMPPLARTLYFADLCGQLAVLVRYSKSSDQQARELLLAQGLDDDTRAELWMVANSMEIN
jgi:HD-like signal output (HDOD) protein